LSKKNRKKGKGEQMQRFSMNFKETLSC